MAQNVVRSLLFTHFLNLVKLFIFKVILGEKRIFFCLLKIWLLAPNWTKPEHLSASEVKLMISLFQMRENLMKPSRWKKKRLKSKFGKVAGIGSRGSETRNQLVYLPDRSHSWSRVLNTRNTRRIRPSRIRSCSSTTPNLLNKMEACLGKWPPS